MITNIVSRISELSPLEGSRRGAESWRWAILDDINLSAEELESRLLSLPHWRELQARAFKQLQGKKECTIAYELLYQMLREEYGIQQPPAFAYGKHGKPFLQDYPDIHFNLSHTRRAIACIVDSKPCGIDVESLGRYKEAVARYSMCDEEMEQILSAEDRDVVFTSLWTQKEALLKLTGEGITDDLKTVLRSSRMDGVNMQTFVNSDKGYCVSIATTVTAN